RELLRTSQEQSRLQSLLCDYYRLVSSIVCERCNYDGAIEHLNTAVRLTELGEEQKALVLLDRGLTLWKANRTDGALHDFERAWRFEKKLPSNLRGSILLQSGRARAEKATTKQERTEVL